MSYQTNQGRLAPALARKIIPVVERPAMLAQLLSHPAHELLILRHCNVFECAPLLKQATQKGVALYVYLDQVDGINADEDGLIYLAREFQVHGILSHHPRLLALAKQQGLTAIQRVFAVDSTGLQSALESVDTSIVDLLDLAPALVIPYLWESLPLPFIGSGLVRKVEHIQRILDHGAHGIALSDPAYWSLS
jgi:glycerol uptake operon antiterminator